MHRQRLEDGPFRSRRNGRIQLPQWIKQTGLEETLLGILWRGTRQQVIESRADAIDV